MSRLLCLLVVFSLSHQAMTAPSTLRRLLVGFPPASSSFKQSMINVVPILLPNPSDQYYDTLDDDNNANIEVVEGEKRSNSGAQRYRPPNVIALPSFS
uniref:Uncharacterized protein n=1 Tax=Plectus sambesii TaxID=2011161 RepID=A0A914WRV3_9BILA